MSYSKTLISRLSRSRPCSSSQNQRICQRCYASIASSQQWPQKTPLGSYYESILANANRSKPSSKAGTTAKQNDISSSPGIAPTSTTRVPEPEPEDKRPKAPLGQPASSDASPPKPPPEPSPQDKVRVIFGSRLLGPAEQADRLAQKAARSTCVAGVMVPPRPEEPDNCCMSGCVNCVWDRFREDLEEWTAKKKEAEAAAAAAAASIAAAGSMDSDGGGSQVNWVPEAVAKEAPTDPWSDEAFQSVPVGIREFMKIEKRLREKHDQQGTIGG